MKIFAPRSVHFQLIAKLLSWALLPIYAIQLMVAPAASAATTVALTDADTLKFIKSATTFTRISTTSSVLADMGKTVGDIVLYRSVGAFGGVSIDAVVTTVSIASGSISVYDSPGSAQTTGTFNENWMINTVGGEAKFRFEFFKSGTYTGLNTGIPVVLQNVKITAFDLDSSSAT
jgi:hypothetical protein